MESRFVSAREVNVMGCENFSRAYEVSVCRIGFSRQMEIPLLSCRISAGFPSPADDYIEAELDLNRYMIRNPPDTFMVRVTNEALAGAGILDGDILIVDRSIGLSRCDCRRDGEWGDVRSASEQKEWKLGP